MLTNGVLQMSSQANLLDIPNAISSPASASGRMPCAAPDGLMTDLFGQALVLASPSAPRAKGRGKLTSDISGLRGFGSSASCTLQQSLVSRLKLRLGMAGSTLFK